MVSQTISHFRILEKLGAGGMGQVYKALDVQLNRTVALKFLSPEQLQQPGARERFLREARAAAVLNHPHIATVYEIAEAEGQAFIAMEYVQGETLSARLSRQPVKLEQALDWSIQVADALTEAHTQGIVHRDIKSSNIIIATRGHAKVLDFGLAKMRPKMLTSIDSEGETLVDEKSLTQAGTLVGTVSYMAPELLRGEDADARSDIFSLGVVMYEIIAGRSPFEGKTSATIMNAILNVEPQPLMRYAAEVPSEMERIVRKALAKDRGRRYQTAKDLLIDLQELKQTLQTEVIRGSSLGGQMVCVAEPTTAVETAAQTDAVEVETRPTLSAPDVPPLPEKLRLIALVVLGLLAVASIMIWQPAPLRLLAISDVGPNQAEKAARDILVKRGVSLFGYESYSKPTRDDELLRFEAHERLSPSERQQIEVWRPVVSYQTILSSADRQDRYYLHTNRQGRLVFLRHELRPDHVYKPIPEDQAAALAQDILMSDFGLDLALFEPLPKAERDTVVGREREFRWRLRQGLPGNVLCTALVRLAGADPVEARVQVEFPPVVMRTIEQEKNLTQQIGWIAFGVLVLIAAMTSILKKTFLFPSRRLFVLVVLGVALIFFIFEIDSLRSTVVEKGWGDVSSDLAMWLLFLVPLFGLIVWAAFGFIVGTLRLERPGLLSGLADVLRGRISKITWAGSAVVGLPAGAVGAALGVLFPFAAWALDVADWSPMPSVDDTSDLILELVGSIIALPFLILVIFGAGLAGLMLVGRWARLGGWIWPGGILLWAVLMTDPNDFDFQPWYLEFLRQVGFGSLFVWIAIRFGLLAGVLALGSEGLLSDAARLMAAGLMSFKLVGVLYVAVWVAVLVLSLIALRRSRAKLA
jgi:predicted Ser/Thr protein kinase